MQKNNCYRISIAENKSYGTTIGCYLGAISQYNVKADRWDLIYTNNYNYMFTAWRNLKRVLRKLKKAEKIQSEYLSE